MLCAYFCPLCSLLEFVEQSLDMYRVSYVIIQYYIICNKKEVIIPIPHQG